MCVCTRVVVRMYERGECVQYQREVNTSEINRVRKYRAGRAWSTKLEIVREDAWSGEERDPGAGERE